MKVLIVYTHPNRQSLNGAFLQQAIAGLHANQNVSEVRTVDLYADGFDPALVFDQEKKRREMYVEPDMEPYRQLVLWSELMVFIYPIWWGRPPAMLLGFFDRLLAAHFAYRTIPGRSLPEGLLRGRSVVCLSTMQGPNGYLQYWLHNAHRVLMRKAVFNYIGIKKVRFFEFGGMEKKNGKQTAYLETARAYFAGLKPAG